MKRHQTGLGKLGFPNRQNTLMQVDVFQLQVQRFTDAQARDAQEARTGSDICDPSVLLPEEGPVRLQADVRSLGWYKNRASPAWDDTAVARWAESGSGRRLHSDNVRIRGRSSIAGPTRREEQTWTSAPPREQDAW